MHIAIIGCGQLARMMALEGLRMGFSFSFLAEPGEGRNCVNGLGSIVENKENLTAEELFKALGEPDVVTVEREHVDTPLLESLTPFSKVSPNTKSIEACQHRGREKNFLNSLGIGTAPFCLADSAESLKTAVQEVGLPVIVKTCGEGYDGKGQWKIDDEKEFKNLLAELNDYNDWIVEKVINFEKEVSIIAARSSNGECSFYPITENDHQGGILVSSIAPAELSSDALSQEATQAAAKILEELDYIGVLSIEFFVVGDKLLVNEMAPRVHNSGHWTQAGGICSQFENHLRCITGMTPGSTTPISNTGMVNLLGKIVDKHEAIESNMQLHDYNKAAQPKRKMGHINIWNTDRQALINKINTLKDTLYGDE